MPGLECMEQTNIFTHTVSVDCTRTRMYGTNQYIHTHTVSVDTRTRMYGTNQYIHTHCVS